MTDDLRTLFRMADQIEDCQKTMKFLYGDQYPARIDEVRPYVKGAMARHNCSEFGAVVHLCKALEKCSDNGITYAMIIATAAEMAAERTAQGTTEGESEGNSERLFEATMAKVFSQEGGSP